MRPNRKTRERVKKHWDKWERIRKDNKKWKKETQIKKEQNPTGKKK